MIPNHRLLRAIARNPHADVWQAEGPRGPVAVHMARSGHKLGGAIDALRKVQHPYVAQLVDADPAETWYTTAWVNGLPIDRWSDAAELEAKVTVLSRVIEGVAAIHAAGLVHGDLSPGNVLVLPDKTPRVLDLEPPEPGAFYGTPGYAAPEVLRAARLDDRTDIYSLGALAWRAFAGAPPFGIGPESATLTALRALAAPPSMLRPGLPSGIEDLVLAMMATNPRARPRPLLRLVDLFGRALATRPRPPLVGLGRPREMVRIALVELFSGRPGVLVLHGPTGSGRRSIIREAVRAARREGLAVVPLASAGDVARMTGAAPCVATAYDAATWCADAVDTVASSKKPILLLVHADRALALAQRVGARQIALPPLTRPEVESLLAALGNDPTTADELLGRTGGRPGAIMQVLQELTPRAPASIESRILAELSTGQKGLPELAHTVGLSEHRTLDHLERLIDAGRVRDVDGYHVAMAI